MSRYPVISVDSVSKSFDDRTVLDNISFDVAAGSIFGYLGRNGAGKTTTIQLLIGRYQPDSGSISVVDLDPHAGQVSGDTAEQPQPTTAETDATNRVRVLQTIGFLPENIQPFSYFTVRGFLEFVGKTKGFSNPYLGDEIEHWAETLSFTGLLGTLTGDLSRGQKQKVMIAQAFFGRPELVLIDEPLANLDPEMQAVVQRLMIDYVMDTDRTIFLSTHQLEVVNRVCTDVAIIDDGHIAYTKEFVTEPAYTASDQLPAERRDEGTDIRSFFTD